MRSASKGRFAASRGFTLVELMVGLAVGAGVIAAALAALAIPVREAVAAQRLARGAEDLRAAELLMHRLLRQATPSASGGPALSVTDGGAVLHAHSADADGTVRGVAWRLLDGALAMRFDGGSWQMLTDPRVLRLRDLQFAVVAPPVIVPVPAAGGCGTVAAPRVDWRFEHRPTVADPVAWTVIESQVRVRHRLPAPGCAS